jgi:hypothetical protein
MAAELDRMLEPGERVVYRARHFREETRAFYPLAIGYLLGYLYISGPLPWPGLAYFVALMLLLGAAFAVMLIRGSYEADVIVTGWRLVAGRGPRRSGVDELALADIVAVTLASEAAPGLIRVRGRARAPFLLMPGAEAREIARGLARAAGLPAPPVPSAKAENIHAAILIGFSLSAMAATILIARQWISGDPGPPAWMSEPALALPLACLGYLLAHHLYTMVALVLIRPFFTAEEVWRWTFSAPDLSAAEKLYYWPLAMWIALLYGRPPGRNCAATEPEAGHGH